MSNNEAASDRDTLAGLIAEHFPEYISGHCLCGSEAPNLASWSAHVADAMATAGVRPPAQVSETSLFVPGDAAPQGSKRHVGGGRMVESSKLVGPWRERVALAAHRHGFPVLTGPVSVALEFVRPRPVSTPKRRTPPAVKKPDLDKLTRAILDALTGIAFGDDAQVTEILARKRLAEIGETPGVWIAVISTAEEVSP
ncbi:RusA family crossover junction endodeoxyribonuclease [Nocardia brasiliensis]|uniref:RusA family crossover junction endodeoxyribonuclease n=1 Tax=Nocardia brasiliensis TaxID=37326 RepID=UPI000B226180|nr:RusA family crossover junction endodeoxyribonuclease [Nocardia brasiliensis]